MAKRLTMFSLRLLLLIVVADIIAAILATIPNQVINLIIDALITITLCVFFWMDSTGYGQKDIKKDKSIQHRVAESGYVPEGEEGKTFKPWFGFAAGLLANVPGFILIVALIFINGESARTLVRLGLMLWNLDIVHIMSTITDPANPALYLFLSLPILLSLVSGLGYMNGPSQQKRLETIIERNKSKKAKRVQDDIKAKQKKGGQSKKRY